MSNITNYSLFFMIELKYRCFYFLLSFFISSFYILFYFNDFLVQLLQPIEYLNLDLNINYLYNFLFYNLYNSFYDLYMLNSKTLLCSYNENLVFDYYPVFEINIHNNNILYLKLFFYLNSIFLFPILLYHFYLFFLPGLYLYEYLIIKKLFICLLLI